LDVLQYDIVRSIKTRA